MNENKLKHLEFIQNVITRMSGNSFLIKGWSVTLVAGLFALAAPSANLRFAVIAYLPVVMFWTLDAFFLSQERQYRGLYGHVIEVPADKIDFKMNATAWNTGKNTWGSVFFSTTLFLFHGSLLLVVTLALIIIPQIC